MGLRHRRGDVELPPGAHRQRQLRLPGRERQRVSPPHEQWGAAVEGGAGGGVVDQRGRHARAQRRRLRRPRRGPPRHAGAQAAQRHQRLQPGERRAALAPPPLHPGEHVARGRPAGEGGRPDPPVPLRRAGGPDARRPAGRWPAAFCLLRRAHALPVAEGLGPVGVQKHPAAAHAHRVARRGQGAGPGDGGPPVGVEGSDVEAARGEGRRRGALRSDRCGLQGPFVGSVDLPAESMGRDHS
mmetsp:Transcript_83914/g.238007  ORF Transcript_83914/g.238007 Transcript_83914/m.238007 type:complete len:241 (+) Transcript_83914:718-1440(+)